MLLTCSLPHTRCSKTVLDFGFHDVGSRFHVLDSEFLLVDSRFQMVSRFSFLVDGKAPSGISAVAVPMLENNATGLECLLYRIFVALPWS